MDSQNHHRMVEHYLNRIEQVHQQQQAEVAELISSTQLSIRELNVPDRAEPAEQTLCMEQLCNVVNEQLKSVMTQLNQQIDILSQHSTHKDRPDKGATERWQQEPSEQKT